MDVDGIQHSPASLLDAFSRRAAEEEDNKNRISDRLTIISCQVDAR
jgi:hypothetical protein